MIRGAPGHDAPPIARFLLHNRDGGEWSYQLEAAPSGRSNALEFAYEEEGLPIDSMLPGERWARTIYAFTSTGAPLRGWVHLDSARVRHMLWSEVLLDRPLYFPDPERGTFHGSPGSAPVRLPLIPSGASRPDYELVPIRAEGDWMQVRVVVPSTCSGSPPDQTVERTVWIRYLDATKRPTVWYYSRGC